MKANYLNTFQKSGFKENTAKKRGNATFQKSGFKENTAKKRGNATCSLK